MRRFARSFIAAGLLLGLVLGLAGCGANDTFSPAVGGGVVNNPTFTLSANPTSNTVTAGNSATYTITATSSGGFNSAVALSASNVPSGATATFNPTSVTPPANGSASSTLTISTTAVSQTGSQTGTIRSEDRGSSVTRAASTITITGTSGSITKQITVDLTINPGT